MVQKPDCIIVGSMCQIRLSTFLYQNFLSYGPLPIFWAKHSFLWDEATVTDQNSWWLAISILYISYYFFPPKRVLHTQGLLAEMFQSSAKICGKRHSSKDQSNSQMENSDKQGADPISKCWLRPDRAPGKHPWTKRKDMDWLMSPRIERRVCYSTYPFN